VPHPAFLRVRVLTFFQPEGGSFSRPFSNFEILISIFEFQFHRGRTRLTAPCVKSLSSSFASELLTVNCRLSTAAFLFSISISASVAAVSDASWEAACAGPSRRGSRSGRRKKRQSQPERVKEEVSTTRWTKARFCSTLSGEEFLTGWRLYVHSTFRELCHFDSSWFNSCGLSTRWFSALFVISTSKRTGPPAGRFDRGTRWRTSLSDGPG
jgi:hypothetical protein